MMFLLNLWIYDEFVVECWLNFLLVKYSCVHVDLWNDVQYLWSLLLLCETDEIGGVICHEMVM